MGGNDFESLESRRLMSTTLLKDINDTSLGSAFGKIGAAHGLVFTQYHDGIYAGDGVHAPTQIHTVNDSFYEVAEIAGGLTLLDSEKLLVTDGSPGSVHQVRSDVSIQVDSSFILMGGVAYFTGRWGNTNALMRSDGTSAGTYKVLDLSNASAPQITATDTHLFFSYTFGSESGVYATDGTPGNRVKVGPPNPLGNGVAPTARLGSKVAFYSGAADIGYHIYVSDGTLAGTSIAYTFDENTGAAQGFVSVGARVVFLATSAATGFEPWSTDGTPAGTGPIADLRPGTANGAFLPQSVAGGAVFGGWNAVENRYRLFFSDGTAAGTRAIVPPAANNAGTLTGISSGIQVGQSQYFKSGSLIYRTDGTATGTARVDGLPSTINLTAGNAVGFNGKLYFPNTEPVEGTNLFVHDLASGIAMVPRPHRYTQSSVFDKVVARFGGQGFFRADDGINGLKMWISNGTPSGTRPLDGFGNTFESLPVILPIGDRIAYQGLGGRVTFIKDDGEVITSDHIGTLAFTVGNRWYGFSQSQLFSLSAANDYRVEATMPAVGNTRLIFNGAGTVVGNRVYFGGYDGVATTLWAYDLTSGTFAQQTDGGLVLTNPRSFAVAGDSVAFVASRGTTSITDYVHLATPQGIIRPLDNGQPLLRFSDIRGDGHHAYFVATVSNENFQKLYRTDGTAAGTVPTWLATGTDLEISQLTSHGGRVYFSNYDSIGSTPINYSGVYVIGPNQSPLLLPIAGTAQRLAHGVGEELYIATGGTTSVTTGTVASTHSVTGLDGTAPIGAVGQHMLTTKSSSLYGTEFYRFAGENNPAPAAFDFSVPNNAQFVGTTPISVTIGFSQRISGFEITDLQLAVDGVPIPLTINTLTRINASTYQLAFAPEFLNSHGRYTLSLDTAAAEITAPNHSPFNESASTSFATFLRGDLSDNGTIDNADIAPFVQALTDPAGYAAAHPDVPMALVGDINRDGVFNNADIAPFVALLTAGRPLTVPPAATPLRATKTGGTTRIAAVLLDDEPTEMASALAI